MENNKVLDLLHEYLMVGCLVYILIGLVICRNGVTCHSNQYFEFIPELIIVITLIYWGGYRIWQKEKQL